MKYRTVTRTRHVPVTINGETRMVAEDYTDQEFVPPHDWDHILSIALGAATGAVSVISVAWTAASVGGLLSRLVPDPVGYVTAGVFDLGWITCQGREWLARHDPRKAQAPRRAGHFALALAMGAVLADGYLSGSVAIGCIGASVSLIAKGLWMLAMRQAVTPLTARTQGWLDQVEDEAAAELAKLGRLRRINRLRHRHAAEAAALAATATAPAQPPGTPDTPAAAPDMAVRTPFPSPPTTPNSPDTAAQYAYGAFLGPSALRALADTDTPDTTPDPVVPIGYSIADLVRAALAAGLRDSADVLTYVRTARPEATPATVERTLRRQAKAG